MKMKMKVVFQIVQHGSLSREVNPWFRPRESRGTGATGNGRVRSCRDNIAGVHSPRRSREMKAAVTSTKVAGQLDWRVSSTKVNWNTHRDQQLSQRCCQALPKGERPSYPPKPWGYTDSCAVGVDPGTNPFMFGMQNMVNPLASLFAEGRRAARRADKSAGIGSWRKQMPSCNRMDRSAVAPCLSRPTSSRLCIARALEEPWQEESK